MIEPQIWLLHKVHYDTRYILDSKITVGSPSELGLAQYAYEAHQPPLPYLIMALFRKVSPLFHSPLLLQLKLLRIISLFAIALGLCVLYIALKAAKIKTLVFYLPLLFIPLLVKDMFFSLNADSFSFLFGNLAVAGVILLIKDPVSPKSWLWLAAGTVLALWIKIPNAFRLAVWPAVLLMLRRKYSGTNVLKPFLVFFCWFLFPRLHGTSIILSVSRIFFIAAENPALSQGGYASPLFVSSSFFHFRFFRHPLPR